MMSNLPILAFFAILAIGNHPSDGGSVTGADFQPQFAEPLENQTVAIGRDATFTCVVQKLMGFRVGWVRADSKAIQAIHTHVITHNPRVSVTHSDHSMWHLHIKGVKEEDRGSYMCQINTDPMISQVATLEVVIPPEFIPEETSGDIMAPEGSTVKLTCKAKGHPTPSIKWRREDGQNITLKSQGTKTQVAVHEGEVLKLTKVARSDMGVYLCIASNSVPPSISKRITVSVHFHPVIHVPNQLVGAPINTDVTLECNVEAYPRSIHFWVKDQGSAMIISGDRYEVQEITKSMFEVKMVLIIRKFRKSDVGSYHCIAKNSLGDVDSVVKLHGIEIPVEGGDADKTGATSNGFDDDDDLDPASYYEMGERDLDITTISRGSNRNRHTYANNKNSVVVGAGGDRGGLTIDGGYGSQNSGTSSSSGVVGSSSHNNHNNNRGKHSNYTPGGERERNNASNNDRGGERRGGKGANEYRNRQERRKTGGNGGKHLDNPMGPGSSHNVYQTQLVPDGISTASSGVGSIHHYFAKSTNNNNHSCNNNHNNTEYDKAFSINSFLSFVLSQFSYFQYYACHYPIVAVISGAGLILQLVQVHDTDRRYSNFLLL